MSHAPELLRVKEQNELDKTLRCVRLVDNNGGFALVADEKYGALFAAAPDMLEALELVVGHKGFDIEYIHYRCRLAIRKARGEE